MAVCSVTCREFSISESEHEFLARFNQLNSHFGLPLPEPDLHPAEELRRLLTFVNLIHLHRGKSALSGTPQLTRYDPSLGSRIVTSEEFWSDRVDNSAFGRQYDFGRGFFEQWKELYDHCLLLPLTAVNVENSDYVNGANNIKNCYLCFHILHSQDCLYSFFVLNSNDIVSSVGVIRSSFCYSCLDVADCYECTDSQDLRNCSSCTGCLDLIGCKHCFGCVGLRNAEYAVMNERVGREAYLRFLESQRLDSRPSREQALKKASAFVRSQRHTVNRCINVEDSSGDYLTNCKNVESSYFADSCEDSGHLVAAHKSKNCYRCFSVESELSYRSVAVLSYNDVFGYSNQQSQNTIYSFLCISCTHCFGCVGLKRKQYAILNREYRKEEYFELLPRIARQMQSQGAWGSFFPLRLSPYYYEDTAVSEYCEQLPEAVLKKRGYHLKGALEAPPPDSVTGVLPEGSDEIDDALLKAQYVCPESGLLFKLQKKELEFHRRNRIPLNELHWRRRIEKLIALRKRIPAI